MISIILFVFWPEEEGFIENCLKGLSWADEIVVIDNGATPKTIEIIKKYTKKIYKEESPDFAVRHNRGKELSLGDWILYLDADERISGKLAEEIKEVVKNPQFSAYQFYRVPFFLGKKVRFGDRYPDYITRLFKKEKLVGWKGEIHESSEVSGGIGKLKNPLYHLTHRDIYSMMAKTINFSEHEARLRLAANHPPVVWWRLLRVIFTEFWARIFRFQGWRGGTESWIDGIFQTFSLFVTYVRLWELQRKPSLSETYKEIDKKIISGEI